MDNMQIYNAVRIVPKEAKKPISAGRLKGMTDINPMWRIKALTEQFGACGIGWYYDVIDKQNHVMNNGAEVVTTVDINLYVKVDGEWSKPIFGTGGSKMQSREKNGIYVNDEAFKMALTDAISVAGKALGMGADVYWDKDTTKYNDVKKDNYESNPEPELNEKIKPLEAKTLEGMIRSYGVAVEDVLKGYKLKSLEDMTKAQYANCLMGLEKKYGKQKGTVGTK